MHVFIGTVRDWPRPWSNARIVLLFVAWWSCSCLSYLQGQAPAPPNIIFIMADDQGWGDLGCYGSEHLFTPHLDRMATEGMRFTQAYAGSPVCGPTRSVLMTGLHSGHTTRRDNRASHQPELPFRQRKLVPLRDEDFTIAEMLKEAGYTTGGIGKWGLGNPGTTGVPWKQGFDLFFGYLDQIHAHTYYTDYLMRNADTVHIPANAGEREAVYSHTLLMQETEAFLRRHQNEPFFLYLPYTLPHGRYVVPDPSRYADRDWPDQVINYAAMISLLDEGVGQIFAWLKELGLDDHTIVFYTSDNGPNPPFAEHLNSNGPFRGVKRQLLEGGIRAPMIVRWPGQVPAGTVSELPWAFWDIMPTLAALAGIEPPSGIDGRSVLPTLLGETQAPPEQMYWEFHNPFQQAVRLGPWKGIRLGTAEPIHLFDLRTDLREEHNLAAEHPEIAARIKQIMQQEHTDSPYWPLHTTANENARHLLDPE